MKKVVHMTSAHPAFDTRIFHKQCRTLKDAGYDVVLIAPHTKDEVRDGIKIKAIKHSNGRFNRMTSITWQIYKSAVNENGWLYHFHDPDLIPIGLLLKLHGKAVIYDVHEHYPHMIKSKDWLFKIFRLPIAFITNLIEIISSLFFDRIVVVLPFIGNRFQKKKIVLVQNFPLKGDLNFDSPNKYNDRAMEIVYHGSITRERGIEQMVSSMELVNEKILSRLLLIGKFDTDYLQSTVIAMAGWKYVDFKGWLERSSTISSVGNARVGLALLLPVPNHMNCLSTKLFEYMAVGIPIVISNFKMWKEIIDKYNCGIAVDPLNVREVANAIVWLMENPNEAEKMGQNGRRAVESEFTWNSEAKKLLRAYSSIKK